MSTRNVQDAALASLTNLPVGALPASVSPRFLGFVTAGPGDYATAAYLIAKMVANSIATAAAVRQYKYTRDSAELATEYSLMAERRRANYDTWFMPRENSYIADIRVEPVYLAQYSLSDSVAREVTSFSVYPRMRKTTPEIDLRQRDNASFGVGVAAADLLDYGRRREEKKADNKQEDRLNVLFAAAEFSFGSGSSTLQNAKNGAALYSQAILVRSTFVTSLVAAFTSTVTANLVTNQDDAMRKNAQARNIELGKTPIDTKQTPTTLPIGPQ
jgi:hypothetical protein